MRLLSCVIITYVFVTQGCNYIQPDITIKENTSYFSNTHINTFNTMYETELDYYINLSWTLGTLNERNYRYETNNNWTQKY